MPRRKRKHLPRHYWPIVCLAWLFWVGAGIAVGVTFDWNPYLAGLIGGGVFILAETASLRRRGY